MLSKTESMNANAHNGVMIATGMIGFEQADARGIYAAWCTGPREHERAAYIRFRDDIAQIEARGLLARFTHRRQLQHLHDSLDGFELERKTETTLAVNLVTTVGKNLALDTYLAGTAYTVVGPYMGLVSSVSWSAVAAADTMASHAGWLEAGGTNAPTYTAPRKTCAWSGAAAGSKALSAALTFAATGTGTVKGCFLAFGAGALTTLDNTAGTLYSVGTFTGGDQPVVSGNTLNVSYTASL